MVSLIQAASSSARFFIRRPAQFRLTSAVDGALEFGGRRRFSLWFDPQPQQGCQGGNRPGFEELPTGQFSPECEHGHDHHQRA